LRRTRRNYVPPIVSHARDHWHVAVGLEMDMSTRVGSVWRPSAVVPGHALPSTHRLWQVRRSSGHHRPRMAGASEEKVNQFALPHGFGGRVVGLVMAVGNADMERKAVNTLALSGR